MVCGYWICITGLIPVGPSAHHLLEFSFERFLLQYFLLRLRSRADVRYLWLESEACDAGGISVSPEVLTTKVPAKVADTPSWNLAPGGVFWILSRLDHSRWISAP